MEEGGSQSNLVGLVVIAGTTEPGKGVESSEAGCIGNVGVG